MRSTTWVVTFAASALTVLQLAACGTQSTVARNSVGPGGIAAGTTPPTAAVPPNAVVERVVDGDTIIADIGGRSESVRLIGIDTPESVARTRPAQCFGEEASLYAQALLPAGTPVTLVLDTEARDTYDRLLAYVVRSGDGLFINFELVEAGYAAAFDYPPNDHYSAEFARAESAAVAAGRGLWSACGGPDVPVS